MGSFYKLSHDLEVKATSTLTTYCAQYLVYVNGFVLNCLSVKIRNDLNSLFYEKGIIPVPPYRLFR